MLWVKGTFTGKPIGTFAEQPILRLEIKQFLSTKIPKLIKEAVGEMEEESTLNEGTRYSAARNELRREILEKFGI